MKLSLRRCSLLGEYYNNLTANIKERILADRASRCHFWLYTNKMHAESQVALTVGVIMALLLIAISTLAINRWIRIPFTVALVLAGMALSWLAGQYPDTLAVVHHLDVSHELILFVFLPTLIFESTLNLDARLLRHNLAPILLLAIPGLLISSAIIGFIVASFTPLPIMIALLLGAILSATDPVAVVAMFKALGAPKRLTVLVEGESLFNDATALVLAGIITGIVTAGTTPDNIIWHSIVEFLLLFGGGLVFGLLLGYITVLILGQVETNAVVEITLTTTLAYLSFLIAEVWLHVSGVMATIGSGLILGGWGWIKVSPSVRIFMKHFWEQLAFIANALIFLMVGITVVPSAVWHSVDMLIWVVIGMLVARVAVVFGLMPLVGRLPGSRPVSMVYQVIIYWGGLRGAIAMAIVLSLPDFALRDTLIVLVMGAVLFTLLFQGLTMEPLVKKLGLTELHLSDQLALLERDLIADSEALQRIQQLQSQGLFSRRIAYHLQKTCEQEIRQGKQQLEELRKKELDQSQERDLLYLRCFSEERLLYNTMYNEGHLSEKAYRELVLVLTLQMDAIRHHGGMSHVHSHRLRRILEHVLFKLLDPFPLLSSLAERMRMRRIIRNYEEVWGHYLGSARVINYLNEINEIESLPEAVFEEVHDHYNHWHNLARQQLNNVTEQFPEFVASMQERLGQRLVLLSEIDATEEMSQRGLLPEGISDQQINSINTRLTALRGQSVSKLKYHPEQLLRSVKLFRHLDKQHFDAVMEKLKPLTLEDGETVIQQGDSGSSFYLIARGVVRVILEEKGIEKELGTLMAGDSFGEVALLHQAPRNATIKCVTPCMFYRLSAEDLEELMEENPDIRAQLEEADKQHKPG
jgi:CPA1 family monovalent cation:H+ antiporter